MKRSDYESVLSLLRLREQRTGERLAKMQSVIDRLEGHAQALRDMPRQRCDDVATAIMQDRFDRWRTEHLSTLGAQIARLNAAAQPERERHVRNVGRTNVMKRLYDERSGRRDR